MPAPPPPPAPPAQTPAQTPAAAPAPADQAMPQSMIALGNQAPAAGWDRSTGQGSLSAGLGTRLPPSPSMTALSRTGQVY